MISKLSTFRSFPKIRPFLFWLLSPTALISAIRLNMAETMQVKKLSEFAIIPTRGSEFAAGFDLSSAYDCSVPARGKALVKTDLAIAIPENTYARIAPRSGLAWKNFIDTGAGVVDYDYRGNVGVILFNHGDVDFEIKRGDRVAQLILERICMAGVEEVDELFETKRGTGGFGSTGVDAQDKAPRLI
jgi:dUTP pyrophosphatase